MSGFETVRAELSGEGYTTNVTVRGHTVIADEPTEVDGGMDKGPTPVELLAGALASCTAITVRMYARRKGWSIDRIDCRVTPIRDKPGAGGALERMKVWVDIEGDLSDAQMDRLIAIGHRCPVHLTLDAGAEVFFS